jgi:Tfp pilus assembly protein PilO
MTGTYEDFRAFLSNLETNVRIFDLKAMSIQPIAKQTNLFGFSLTVAAYYQP